MGTVPAPALARRALEPAANAAQQHPASSEVLRGIRLELFTKQLAFALDLRP